MLTVVAALLLTAIFFISGLKKVRGFEDSAMMIAEKLPFLGTDAMTKLATVLVIILELLAPIIIVYAVITRKNYFYAYIASMALAVFVLLTAVMFYYPPTGDNQLMFMLHLALTGGLIALAQLFRR